MNKNVFIFKCFRRNNLLLSICLFISLGLFAQSEPDHIITRITHYYRDSNTWFIAKGAKILYNGHRASCLQVCMSFIAHFLYSTWKSGYFPTNKFFYIAI
jgi:hypothetical protein